ncbi:putative amidase [Citrus sinensis]|nr:putative amidase [Citrus sinensis]
MLMGTAINAATSISFSITTVLTLLLFIPINGQDQFTIIEATIDEIQTAFDQNKLTSTQLVEFYITQIETLNPRLRSVIEVNPDARSQAEKADLARKRNQGRRFLGELHGIPVLLKDTFATKDKLNTSAGSYALVGSVVPRDATVVERLRDAGAVILGKASLTEWYSFRALGKIPNGWCARAGQAKAISVNKTSYGGGTRVPSSEFFRQPASETTGIGTQKWLWDAIDVLFYKIKSLELYWVDSRTNLTYANGRLPLVGCTTSAFDVKNLHTSGLNAEVNPYLPSGDPCGSSSGSAISVAANMVTVSLGSETHGSILCPADHNSVVGLKPTVGLTSRAGVIPVLPQHDTIGAISRTVSDAVYLLDVIVGFDSRDYEATSEAAKYIPVGGYKQFLNENGLKGKRLGVVRNLFSNALNGSTVITAFENHLNTLRQSGATIVDDLEMANVDVISNPGKSGELTAMLAGFKIALNEYLQELVSSPVRSLADVISFNQNNADMEKTKEYGQGTFISAEKTSGFGEKERKAVELMEKLSQDGIEKLMTENELDALVTPGTRVIPVLALGGYPGITVPAGYEGNQMPFGICFGGLKGTEPKLIEIAYAFEQATMIRRPPFVTPFWIDER